jgi:predicted ester cyclase
MGPKELVQRQADTWNARDREGFFATCAEDCEVTAPGFTGKGRQGLEEFWSLWMDGFPDNQVMVGLVFAEGDHVAEEARFEGTNSGPLAGPDGSQIPAIGLRASAAFSALSTVRGDKVATTRSYFDQVELLTQLGLMPG